MFKRFSFSRSSLLVILVFAVLASILVASSQAGANVSRLAYLANGPQGSDLYMIDSDGSDRTKVDTSVYSFSWSPDGQRVVYNKTLGQSIELYTADTSGVTTRLFDFCASTGNGLDCRHPIWSPDGTQIAFDAGDIYTVDADGTNVKKVTRSGQAKLVYGLSDWSAKGLLSFSACSGATGLCRVGVIKTDGTGHKLVSPKAYGADGGAFNAEGSRLAYVAGKNSYDAYTVKPNGRGRKRLTDTKRGESDIDWRPDGRVSFSMQGPNYTYTLWRVDADGKNRLKLQGGDNGPPDWRAADGASVFVKVIDKKLWLVVGDENAKHLTKIYDPPGFMFYPAWGGEVTE